MRDCVSVDHRPLVLEDAIIRADEAAAAPILAIDALTVPAGQVVGIAGPSGAGKTTLLAVLAGLAAPGAGRLFWGDDLVSAWPTGRRDAWRRHVVGLVFQDFALIPEMTVVDNILLPARFGWGRLPAGARPRALDLLTQVGLDQPGRRASLLSRGEQQRVAVARALLGRPALLMADEPTASLDGVSGQAVIDLLCAAARDSGATLVAVSHDRRLLDCCDRVVSLDRGRVVADGKDLP